MKWWNTIYVDFDGTIVKHRWPRVGELREDAISSLQLWRDLGGRIVIFSTRNRHPVLHEEMIKFLIQRGVPYDEIYAGGMRPDGIIIDDKAINAGVRVNWGDIISSAVSIRRQKESGIPTGNLILD